MTDKVLLPCDLGDEWVIVQGARYARSYLARFPVFRDPALPPHTPRRALED